MVALYWRKLVERVGLDFEGPLTLFATFFIIFSLVGWVSVQLPFDTEFFGVK